MFVFFSKDLTYLYLHQ